MAARAAGIGRGNSVPPGSSHPRYTLYSAVVPALRRIVSRELPLPLICGARGGGARRLPADLRAALGRRPVAPVPDLALPPRRVPALEQPVVRGPVRVRELQRLLLPARGAHRASCRCSSPPPPCWPGASRPSAGASGAARPAGRRSRSRAPTPFVSIVSGSYPFTAGAACAALALLALQRRRRVLFAVAVLGALGFSPLAFAVLLALLAGLLLGHPQPVVAARRHWAALAVVVVVAARGRPGAARVPERRHLPLQPDGRGRGRAVLARRALRHRQEPAGAVAAHALRRLPDPEPGRVPVQEPGRIERHPPVRRRRRAAPVARGERQPAALAGGGAAAPGRDRRAAGRARGSGMPTRPGATRPRRSPTGARRSTTCAARTTTSTGSRRSPPGATGRPTTSPGPGSRSPAGGSGRTTSPRTAVLYRHHLTAAAYDRWLRLLGVRFVVLPDATLDYSSTAEARLLRSGSSGLELVSESRHLRIYELPDAAADRLGARRRRRRADPPGQLGDRVLRLGAGQLPGARALHAVLEAGRRGGVRGERGPRDDRGDHGGRGLVDLRLEPSLTDRRRHRRPSSGSGC